MENPLKPQRKAWLDMAKEIAILAVLVGHSFPSGSIINRFIFSFHMPLFFIAAGFTLSVSREPVDFITNKVKKFILPYLSFGLLSALVWIIKRPLMDDHNTIVDILGYVGRQYAEGLGVNSTKASWSTAQPVGPVWFIPCLFLAELVFYGVIKLCRDNDVALFFTSTALTVSGAVISKFIFLPLSFDISLFCQIFLLVGYMMKKHDLLNRKISFEGWAALIVLWFVGIFVHVSMNNREYHGIALPVICAVAACYVIFRICMALEKVIIFREPLSYYGRFSIILLMFQFWDKTVFDLPKILPFGLMYDYRIRCYAALSVFRILMCTCAIELIALIPGIRRCFGMGKENKTVLTTIFKGIKKLINK